LLLYIYIFIIIIIISALCFPLYSYYLMAAWCVLWPCVFSRLAGGVLGSGENFSVSHVFLRRCLLKPLMFLSALIFAKFQLPCVSPNF